MDKVYNHKKYENGIYELWEKNGAFAPGKNGKAYTILMPPPNANASLHAGHAMYTVDDILTRWKRMQGYSSLWIPGLDHAGFETQYVYEKELADEGKSRMDFDRQTLYKNVFKFVKENSGLIYEQFKRLGFSADWERSVFTLDPQVLKRVFKTFKQMEMEGRVYRSEYIVNFCTHCGTSLADLEVEHKERTDPLYYVRYPLLRSPNEYLVVATTRPEPIWADTHLAVNPKDKKNKQLVGKKVKNPLTGVEMEIIGDEFVDPEFGTGVVKLTPAHDAADFEVAKRHNLPIVPAVDLIGRMRTKAGKYAGLRVAEARKKVVSDLKENGLIEKINENYHHTVNLCYRCGRVLEPVVVPNWFIKVEELKKPVIEAVKKNKVKFFPKRFKKHMLDWLEIMHDWPISRQIVWGIRIPAWYSLDKNPDMLVTFLGKNKKVVSGKVRDLLSRYNFREIEEGLQTLTAPKGSDYIIRVTKPGERFLQETDTFDTWFSSGQWPLITLREKEFETRFPTDVLATLSDILKFWVSRMIMFSLYLKKEVPFRDVYLWSMVADEKGVKMSKSKGNVTNPLDLVEKYGADSLRMSLLYGTSAGSKVILSDNKVKGMRNFSNKIWNIARFVLQNNKSSALRHQPLAINSDDKWILKELEETVKKVTGSLEKYRLNSAAEEIYNFVWHKFADRYIEKVKPRIANSSEDSQTGIETLYWVLNISLRLLHPFMPFVTEAIWSFGRARNKKVFDSPLLISASWPKVSVNS